MREYLVGLYQDGKEVDKSMVCSIQRWIKNGVVPKQQTGNKCKTVMSGGHRASLSTGLIQTDLATGISGGVFYFLATSTANTEITSANVKRINLTTKKGSTKAYQAFTPKNTHLHFCFWNFDFHEMFGMLLLSRPCRMACKNRRRRPTRLNR